MTSHMPYKAYIHIPKDRIVYMESVRLDMKFTSELRHERDDDEDWSNIENDQGE
jgi:hypothetical protein